MLTDFFKSPDGQFVEFVRYGSAGAQMAAFFPLGALVGWLIARWVRRLGAGEFAGSIVSSRKLGIASSLLCGGLFATLALAVSHTLCQAVPEGGTVDYSHWRLLFHFTLIALLLAATLIDLDQYIIPDEITVPGTLVGVVGATLGGDLQLMHVWVDWNHWNPITGPFIPEWIKHHHHWHGLLWSLAGLTVGAAITWIARLIAQSVLKVEALGFGDVTLMAMIGSYLGWQPVVFVFLIAPMCGLFMGLLLKLAHGRKAVPYGPYISLAALIVLLTWRWLWTPTREIFGHWPTLLGLFGLMTVGMAALLGLLRLYRSIPVTRRNS